MGKFKDLFNWLFLPRTNNAAGARQRLIELKELVSLNDATEDFVDISLAITDSKKTDLTHVFIAKGLHEGQVVSLKVELPSYMQRGLSAAGELNPNAFIRDRARFRSVGIESDAFVKALASLYLVPSNKKCKKQVLIGTIFCLSKTASRLDKPGYFRYKLFFNDGYGQENYAELYLNVNTETNILEICEKDPEYRAAIISNVSN